MQESKTILEQIALKFKRLVKSQLKTISLEDGKIISDFSLNTKTTKFLLRFEDGSFAEVKLVETIFKKKDPLS